MAENADTAAAEAQTDEANSAPGESLDDVLNEYDEGTKEPAKTEEANPATGGQAASSDDRIARLERESAERRERDANEQARKAIDTCVDSLGSKLSQKVPKRALEGYLDTYARQNPKLIQAFVQRETNPKAWDRVLTAIATEIDLDFKREDSAQTDQAVAAAVRSASTKQAPAETEEFSDKKVQSMNRNQLYSSFPGLGRR